MHYDNLSGHRDSVNALCFLSDNELASGSGDGMLKIWNLASRRPVVEVKASETSSVLSLSHIRESSLLIS
jgi:WD40 repeat protein